MRGISCILIVILISCGDNPKSTGTLVDNKKQGEWKTYYSNGRLLKIENFVNDTLDGKQTIYSDNGNVYTSTTYRMGIQTDSFLHYFSNGKVNVQEWADSNGRKQGLFKVFYENGELSQIGYFKDNHLDDSVKTFYKNGNPKTLEYYKNGKREGIWKYYNELGRITKVETYKNDIKAPN